MLLMSHQRKCSEPSNDFRSASGRARAAVVAAPRRRRNSRKSYVGTTECQADRGVTTRNPSTPFTGDRAGSQGPSLNEALGRAVFGIDEDDVLGIAPRPAPAPRGIGGAFAAEWPRVLARALRPLKEPGVPGSLYQSVGFASVAVSNTARSAHRRCRIEECNWSRAVARTMT